MGLKVAWLCVLVSLTMSQSAEGIINSTAMIYLPSGLVAYPCQQLNHTIRQFESLPLGQWYAIEIIQHKDDRTHGSQYKDVCPKLNLYKTSENPSQEHVTLSWHERAGDVLYKFWLVDPENKGFWLVRENQTGSMVNQQYQQFPGSVQVLEADPNKMVLMFCTSHKISTHYSVILVRNATIPHDNTPVHKMLEKFGLPEHRVFTLCKDNPNSSTAHTPSVLAIVLSSLIILAFRNSKTEIA